MTDWDRLLDELYLKTYAAVQRDEDPAPLVLGAVWLAGCEPPADILDAACGYGRHARVLAGAGYRVVGLDRSPVLLGEARRGSEGLKWPRWVRGDYRELPFAAESFDAVVNLFTSFGFFGEEGDLQALTEFRRVLRPERALVLETMHRDRLMASFQARKLGGTPRWGSSARARGVRPRRRDRRNRPHVLAGRSRAGHLRLPVAGLHSQRASGWRSRRASRRSGFTAIPGAVRSHGTHASFSWPGHRD